MTEGFGTDRVAFRGERVLVGGELRPAAVVVEDGRIVDVLGPREVSASGPSMRVEELGESVLLPGLVDAHVHLNEPGRAEWEGFETGTAAAARGGITTLVDMPLNCIPVTTSGAALEAKLDAMKGRLHVDVGLWGGVVPGNAGELGGMAGRGILGAKAFLCHSGIDDFPAATRADLLGAMPVLRDAGAPLLVHAELESGAHAPACAGEVRAYATYLASRPPAWEDAAIALVIELCRLTGCVVHVVHLSAASAIPLIRRAKEDGIPLTVETCPHYLCLSAEEVPEGATEWKCAPPIREAANREGLWAALQEGVIDLVSSDHSPCTPGLKKPEEGDFCGAWGGIASLSLGLPSLWREASIRGLSLPSLVRLLSDAPARLAGLAGRKGRIARGMDADLVAFDPDVEETVAREALPFRNRVSPYVGRKVRGRVRRTWLRGRLVHDEGRLESAASGRALLGR